MKYLDLGDYLINLDNIEYINFKKDKIFFSFTNNELKTTISKNEMIKLKKEICDFIKNDEKILKL